MTKFIRNLAVFVAGLPFVTTKAAAPVQHTPTLDHEDNAVSLRPLNREMDNLFASHRSHSSHASHSSHYSGSGSNAAPAYVAPAYVAPEYVAPTRVAIPASVPSPPPESANVTGKAGTSADATGLLSASAAARPAEFTLAEKRRLQVLRVQMRLNSLELYDGQMTGVLDSSTIQSLKLFQAVKKLPTDGMMTTPTMNALGIPTVK